MDGNIVEGNEPDGAIAPVQDRHASDAHLSQPPGDILDVIIIETIMNFLGHHIAHLALGGRFAVRNDADDDIPVRDNADHPVFVQHRQDTDISASHDTGGALDGIGGRHDGQIAGTDLMKVSEIRCRARAQV